GDSVLRPTGVSSSAAARRTIGCASAPLNTGNGSAAAKSWLGRKASSGLPAGPAPADGPTSNELPADPEPSGGTTSNKLPAGPSKRRRKARPTASAAAAHRPAPDGAHSRDSCSTVRSALYHKALTSTGAPARGVTTQSPALASIHVSCKPRSAAATRPSAS